MDMDKILVIDDSPVQAQFLKSILKERYEVTMCHTAQEGLNAAMTGSYSLVLLDVIMPDMDGFAVLSRLQERELTKYIPVILITGLSDIQNEEKGLTMGAVDYIAKPFNPVIVRARVNTHIKLYHYQSRFRAEALVDNLTGVANRRSYEGSSLTRWRECMRLGCTFSVCMMDIDKFKNYNDTYGHQAGDQVIAAVGKEISSHLKRITDFFARYGGEEFVAIMVGEKAEDSYEHMKKVRQAVEDLHIEASAGISPWVTISAGGVTFQPREGDAYDSYLHIADDMLYRAKELGRNRVVWSNQGREQWSEK